MTPSARRITVFLALMTLQGCAAEAPAMLGSLEYERITVPAPAAERIVAIEVREGQQVDAGTVLMTLDASRTQAQQQAVDADTARQRSVLAELEAGSRPEAIAQARAQWAAARAQAAEAQRSYERLAALGRQRLIAAIEVDRARTAAQTAQAQAQVAQETLAALQTGTRREQIAAGRSAVAAATANAQAHRAVLDRLTITAPRAGRIDSLPYRLGDQAPVGAPLAVLLVGAEPYARVYVPAPMRIALHVGDAVDVRVDGRDTVYRGRIRMIRNEPGFTPYFALAGKDAARLSYLAEVQLGKDAGDLPAGVPVRVTPAR